MAGNIVRKRIFFFFMLTSLSHAHELTEPFSWLVFCWLTGERIMLSLALTNFVLLDSQSWMALLYCLDSSLQTTEDSAKGFCHTFLFLVQHLTNAYIEVSVNIWIRSLKFRPNYIYPAFMPKKAYDVDQIFRNRKLQFKIYVALKNNLLKWFDLDLT